MMGQEQPVRLNLLCENHKCKDDKQVNDLPTTVVWVFLTSQGFPAPHAHALQFTASDATERARILPTNWFPGSHLCCGAHQQLLVKKSRSVQTSKCACKACMMRRVMWQWVRARVCEFEAVTFPLRSLIITRAPSLLCLLRGASLTRDQAAADQVSLCVCVCVCVGWKNRGLSGDIYTILSLKCCSCSFVVKRDSPPTTNTHTHTLLLRARVCACVWMHHLGSQPERFKSCIWLFFILDLRFCF